MASTTGSPAARSPASTSRPTSGSSARPWRSTHVELDVELRQELARACPQRANVDETVPRTRLSTKEDVLGDREVGQERELLVDDGDSEAARVVRGHALE